jgi:hypothetical protein
MAGNLFVFPRAIAFDVGVVQPGAKITFTATGTTDPQNTYTDIALTTPSTNPVVADAEGLFVPIYLDPTLPDYRVKYTDSVDALIYQEDDVPASQSGESLTLTGAAPFIDLIETDAGADNTSWRIQVNSEQLTLQLANDALAAFTDILTVDRTTNVVDTINLKPTTLQHNGITLPVIKVKTATTSKNTDITLADDPHLAGWSLTASKHYAIEAYLMYDQSVGDIKFKFDFSQTPVVVTHQLTAWASDEAGTQYNDTQISVENTVSITTMVDGEFVGLNISAGFQANASIGGTLDFQWAQDTSDGNNTRVKQSSWMRITQLD